MAIFDPALQRLCVRIVYDGAGGTGKTTNLKAICSLFAAQHAMELHSPGEVDGRTLYFDWVQILAGMVLGFPLLCQVISVPGQSVLTPRRRHLLSTADVIVLVCDSSPVGVERGQEALRLIDEVNTAAPGRIPLVLQANKQDQVHAVPGRELAARLGREDVTAIEAIATDGIGVIDTFVGAVRVISREIQRRSEEAGWVIPVGASPGAAEVLAELKRQEVDPEWAAEMFLEEVQAALLVSGSADPPPHDGELRRGAPPLLPRADVETGFVWPAHSGRLVLQRLEAETGPDLAVPLGSDGRALREARDHVLRTARGERFHDREEARQALVKAARQRTQLDPRSLLEAVLVVQPARDGAFWLWTVLPRLPSLAEVLSRAADDPSAEPDLLGTYGAVAADVLRACMRHDFGVDLRPASFALIQGALVYAGEIAPGTGPGGLGRAVHEATEALSALGLPLERFLESLDRALRRDLSDEEARAVSSLLESAPVAGA